MQVSTLLRGFPLASSCLPAAWTALSCDDVNCWVFSFSTSCDDWPGGYTDDRGTTMRSCCSHALSASKTVSFWSGVPQPAVGAAEAWRWLQEGVFTVLEHARMAGVEASFEPEPGMLVETVDDWRRLAETPRLPAPLFLALDVGHLLVTGEREPAAAVREFAAHGWDARAIPDPQDPATFLASKLAPTQAGALPEWTRKVMAARHLTTASGAWERHPVSVTERGAKQLTMTGPVLVHANLSDEPVAYEGRPLAVFGDVAVDGARFTLRPDAVALVRA